jgi:acetyltransferase
MTNAQGIGIMAAKQLLRCNGTLAALSEETLRAMDALLPPYWNHGNPIHLLRNADTERYVKAAEICLKDPGVDGLLVIYTPQDFASAEELAVALIAQAAKTDKPLLAAWMGGRDVQRGRELMVEQGIPAYETAEAAVRTYIYMTQYERNLQLLHETPAELPLDEAPPKNHLKALVRRSCREARFILTEEDSWKFLRNYGIPVIPSRTAFTLEEALACQQRYRSPEGLLPGHNLPPGCGSVITGIDSDESLKAPTSAYSTVPSSPAGGSSGVTVQKCRHIDYELILG